MLNMKNRSCSLVCSLLIFCMVFIGCENTNLDLAADAGMDAIKAITLSDEEVAFLAGKASKESDAKHVIAGPESAYAARLKRIAGTIHESDGYRFNFKVYLSPKINAFAMADGTIRIYSGLMDMMSDHEVAFVVGHEMGHVVEKHIKKKIMLAYAASSLRKGIASQEGVAGDIARSSLGGLVQALLNAQFSQAEEKEADDFGLVYLKQQKKNQRAAVSALKKLSGLGKSHSFLSSHPDPDLRAKRLQDFIDNPGKIDEPSTVELLIVWVKNFVAGLLK